MAKTIIGKVSSISGDKTVTIVTHWRKTHPIYKKQFKVSAKYMAHDEKNECRVGDQVLIEETRPLSAKKRHVLSQILQRAELTEEQKALFKEEVKLEPKEEKAEAELDAIEEKPVVKADEAKPKPASAKPSRKKPDIREKKK